MLTCAIWLCGASSGQLAIPENLHLCLLHWLGDARECSLIQIMYLILNVFSFKIPVLLLLINLCFIFDRFTALKLRNAAEVWFKCASMTDIQD